MNCCRDGLKIEGDRYTDKICRMHPDLGAQTRAKAWVKSALYQVDNGSTTDELREFYLK